MEPLGTPRTASSGRRLRVGLTAPCRPLEALLEQIGVDHGVVDRADLLSDRIDLAGGYSCLILHDPLPPAVSDRLRRLASARMLSVLDLCGEWSGLKVQERTVWLRPDPGDPILGHTSDLPRQPFTAMTAPSAPWLEKTLRADRRLPALWCGWPLHRPMSDFADAHASYPCASHNRPDVSGLSTKPQDPSERITREPRALRRHLLEWMLTWLHGSIGLPLVRKSCYPGGARSVLLFRVDSDYGDREACGRLLEALDRLEVRSTWFLHLQAHDGWLDRFAHLQDHELALHAWRHADFHDPAARRLDAARAAAAWNKAFPGRPPIGYASPFGRFNPGTARLLADGIPGIGRFEYASDFAYDADNLPSRPMAGRQPLQIPIHPICPGSFARTASGLDAARGYFKARVRLMLHRSDPLAFYHHPMQPGFEALESAIGTMRELDAHVPNLTFAQWANWWRNRSETRFEARMDPQGTLDVRWSARPGFTESPAAGQDLLRFDLVWFGESKDAASEGALARPASIGTGRRWTTCLPEGVYSKDRWGRAPREAMPSAVLEGMDPRFRINRSRSQWLYHRKSALLDHLGRLLQ